MSKLESMYGTVPHPADDISRPTARVANKMTRMGMNARDEVVGEADLQPTGFIIAASDDPKYRLLEYMAASGKTRRDIATSVGMSYSWVCQIFKQQWFKTNVAKILQENGSDAIQSFLQVEAMPSLEVVSEIRDDPEAPAAARLSAANSILDRLLGKPKEKIEVTNKTNKAVEAEADKLLEEAKELQSKLRAQGVSFLSSN